MGCCTSTNAYRPKALVLNADYENYKSAGVCFKNETHMLAGVQTIKKEKMISGFGGKRERSDESYYHTAFREMIEELFECKGPNDIILLCFHFEPKEVLYFEENLYVLLVFDFKQLKSMLEMFNKKGLKPNAYSKFPLTIDQLMFERIKMNSEITNICLVPLETNKYDKWFVDDLNYFKPKVQIDQTLQIVSSASCASSSVINSSVSSNTINPSS
jgi:hypothetical protein